MRRFTAWESLIVAIGSVLGAFALYLWSMAPGLTWAHDGADGGDLAMAVALKGVPHPTGYPTYLAIGALFAQLPVKDIAWRLNMMSVVMAALAVGMMAWVGCMLAESFSLSAPVGGIVTGGIVATGTLFWSQALITEVYTLHALFVAVLLIWSLAGISGKQGRKWAFAGGLTIGLGLGNHISLILLLPGLFWAIGRKPHRDESIALSGGLLAGLSVYALIPLRAHLMPPVNWGGADNWSGFWWLVSGQLYRGYLRWPGFHAAGIRLTHLAILAKQQFEWWGLGLALWGLLAKKSSLAQRYARVTLWTIAAFGLWAVFYQVTDWQPYSLPIWITLAPWVLLGIMSLTREVNAPRTLVIGLILVISSGVLHAPAVNLRADTRALVSTKSVWAAIEPNALVLVDGDRATFGLGYTHFVGSQRPDVCVINRALWSYPWYRQSLQKWYSDLLPREGPTHLGAIVAAHPQRPLYLVGDTLAGGIRLAPGGPFYRVHRIPVKGDLKVGKMAPQKAKNVGRASSGRPGG